MAQTRDGAPICLNRSILPALIQYAFLQVLVLYYNRSTHYKLTLALFQDRLLVEYKVSLEPLWHIGTTIAGSM